MLCGPVSNVRLDDGLIPNVSDHFGGDPCYTCQL